MVRRKSNKLKIIENILQPHESILVADSLTGQDAANVAKSFGETINITGSILTRVDGDGRGGAALSIKSITGAPIKFIGTGEKIEKLEVKLSQERGKFKNKKEALTSPVLTETTKENLPTKVKEFIEENVKNSIQIL